MLIKNLSAKKKDLAGLPSREFIISRTFPGSWWIIDLSTGKIGSFFLWYREL